jgi:hypothetical protein
MQNGQNEVDFFNYLLFTNDYSLFLNYSLEL